MGYIDLYKSMKWVKNTTLTATAGTRNMNETILILKAYFQTWTKSMFSVYFGSYQFYNTQVIHSIYWQNIGVDTIYIIAYFNS